MSEIHQVAETDKAWAAGFVDGEGCIALIGRSQVLKGKTYQCFVLSLHVANTDIRTLERLKTMFGGTIYPTNHKNRPNNKPCWTWYCRSALAAAALDKLLPYLFSKKEQAELGIASRRYIQGNGRPRAEGNLEAQSQISTQLKHLKRVA